MKNPMDMTLGEIQALLLLDGNPDLFPNDLLCYLAARAERVHNYQVQAVTKLIKEKPAPVEKRVTTVDADLLNACVLVHEDLSSESNTLNN